MSAKPPQVAPLIAVLVAVLWVLGLVGIVADLPGQPWLSDAPLVLAIGVAVIVMPWRTRVLCLALAGATAGLAWAYDQWAAIPGGLARAAIFPAFLATIVLLRATADQRPEIATARRLFGAIGEDERGGGVAVGAFMLGSVLQVGVFAVFSPIVGRDAPVDERMRVFMSAVRGMSLVPLWSPFIVATGIAVTYLPAVPIWQNMALGLVMAALSLLIAVTLFERGPDGARFGRPATVWRALLTLAPVLPPIAGAALIVVGGTMLTGLSTLQALVLLMPVPCLLAIAGTKGGDVRAALRVTATGMGRIGSEISFLTFAMTLGVVFEAALPETGVLDGMRALALSPTAVIFIVIMTMNLAGLCGIHPIVTGTIALVVFTGVPTGVADLVLMQAMLVGWGLCTTVSIGSLSIVTGAAMFDLASERLITGVNIVFVLVTSAVIAALLSVLNGFLIG